MRLFISLPVVMIALWIFGSDWISVQLYNHFSPRRGIAYETLQDLRAIAHASIFAIIGWAFAAPSNARRMGVLFLCLFASVFGEVVQFWTVTRMFSFADVLLNFASSGLVAMYLMAGHYRNWAMRAQRENQRWADLHQRSAKLEFAKVRASSYPAAEDPFRPSPASVIETEQWLNRRSRGN